MLNLKTKNALALVAMIVLLQVSHAQETLNWVNDIPVGGWPASTLGPHSNSTLCHSRGTFTSTVLNPLGLTLVGGQPSGNVINNNSIIHGISNIPNGQGISQVFSFGYPVENLTFSIFDIDGASGNWQDRLIVTATLSATSVPITIATCPPAAGTVCTGSGTNTAQVDAGTTRTDFTVAAGRADFSIAGAIDSVTIQYQNHTVPTSSTQFISITELTYNCAIVGVSKVMTRRTGQAFGISPYIVDIDFNFENFGDVTLSNLTSLEDLEAVFNVAPNVGNYTVTSITKTSGPASFTANASFDGNATQELIGATSSLTPGQTASIRVSLDVLNYDSYTNTITVDGTTPQSATTSDASTNGTDSDGSDGDDNPDESTPSTLNTTTLPVSLNYLATYTTAGKLTINWQADIEFEHIGYRIYQEDSVGKRHQISKLIHQPMKQLNQAVRSYQTTVAIDSNNPIWLAEYSNKGVNTWYGPFSVNSTKGSKIEDARIKHLANKQSITKTLSNTLAIGMNKTGMHRITTSELISAGMDLTGIRPNSISLKLGNKSIPYYINGNNSSFDSTTSIDFYASNIDSLYTNKRVYKLSIGTVPNTELIENDKTLPSTVIDTWYWQEEKYNPNLIYDFSSPTDDPWRAETLATFANSTKNIDFPLDELANIPSQKIKLKLHLSGAINYQQIPENYPNNESNCGANHPDIYPGMPNDHCLSVHINNTAYEDIVFDGLTIYNREIELNANVADTGVVSVALNLPGQTGFAYDIVNIENIAITYPRNLVAINNVLTFNIANSSKISNDLINRHNFDSATLSDSVEVTHSSKASIVVAGFTANNIVAYALNSGAPVRILNGQITNNENAYTIKLPTVAQNQKYWVSTKNQLLKPTLNAWVQEQPIINSNTQYLIISHPDFITTVEQIKNLHENNGLNVAIVNIDNIYQEYSNSIIDPYAIKDYIKKHSSTGNLKYILLVGSDNYDYKNFLSNQNISHIPSLYVAIDDVVRYAPTDSLFTDIDGDNIPDIAIGRLPVRTNQELQLLIDKQNVFMNQSNENLASHMIADSQDTISSYSQISNELANLIPNSWTKLTSYRDDFADTTSAKQQILSNFTHNPRLTTYLGHSGPRNWFSFPSAFNYNDIESLDNNLSPSVIMQWGCWNSYYVEPAADTMAHKFLFSNNKGAVAVLGASALTAVTSEKEFARLILPELFKEGISIGQAILIAKQKLALQGEYKDIILGWNLLGDPALYLQSP